MQHKSHNIDIMQQGRQREASVKTLRSALNSTPRLASEMKILNISFPRVEIEPTKPGLTGLIMLRVRVISYW